MDFKDRKQLYEQIIDSVKKLILSGEMKKDDKLPSVRSLAKELALNPNTIQKAYTELERSGIIVTMQGRGSIILADPSELRDESREKLIEKMEALASEMKLSGIEEKEFTEAALNGWKRAARTEGAKK
ncbi:MAG: GntR family transcriptional regulator [bacterium]|nr:GntR family transcriptional regulator [bacterium]